MICERLRLPDGSTAIVCRDRGRGPRCQWGGCKSPAVAECDYPMGAGTCSARVCRRHCLAVGPADDRCPDHARELLELVGGSL